MLCIPGWPLTLNPTASVSPVLELKVCTAVPSLTQTCKISHILPAGKGGRASLLPAHSEPASLLLVSMVTSCSDFLLHPSFYRWGSQDLEVHSSCQTHSEGGTPRTHTRSSRTLPGLTHKAAHERIFSFRNGRAAQRQADPAAGPGPRAQSADPDREQVRAAAARLPCCRLHLRLLQPSTRCWCLWTSVDCCAESHTLDLGHWTVA